jgi:hypothetical protein
LEREHLHTRTVEFNAYRRSDGMFDIEAQMRDFRRYDTVVFEKGVLPSGESVHHMTITATVDEQLVVRTITSQMRATPFSYCREVEESLRPMVGARMAQGWRRSINERLGGTRSCTHLRELLVNMATAALQTIPTWQAQQRIKARETATPAGTRPHYLGQCHAWKLDGPVVLAHFPQFFQPQEPKGPPAAKE